VVRWRFVVTFFIYLSPVSTCSPVLPPSFSCSHGFPWIFLPIYLVSSRVSATMLTECFYLIQWQAHSSRFRRWHTLISNLVSPVRSWYVYCLLSLLAIRHTQFQVTLTLDQKSDLTPLQHTPRPHTHASIPSLRAKLRELGEQIAREGTPSCLGAFVVGVTG
jgi:hypothetical protein